MIKGYFSTIFLVLTLGAIARADHTTCPPTFSEVGQELAQSFSTLVPTYSTRPPAGDPNSTRPPSYSTKVPVEGAPGLRPEAVAALNHGIAGMTGGAVAGGAIAPVVSLTAVTKTLSSPEPVARTKLNEVTRATHSDLGIRTEVAVKRPLVDPADPAGSAAARRLHANEQSILASLEKLPYGKRQYFPKVVETGKDFIATEWNEGRTLRELISSGQVDGPGAAKIMSQLRDALESLHSQNLVHGDIKPENVIVLNDGRVKLIDFGNTVPKNQPYFSAGTTSYAHPDQAALKPAEFSHDWHSFHLVENELAAHARPAPTPPESYKKLADQLGVDLTHFQSSEGFDWRKFYLDARVKFIDRHVPADLLPELERLEKEHGKLFSARESLAPAIAAEKAAHTGPLADGRPFPRSFNRAVHSLDRTPLSSRVQNLGRVSWESGGKNFTAEVLTEDFAPVADLLKFTGLDKNFRHHLENLSPNDKIRTVKTRIHAGNDNSLAKFELHLIERPDGKKTLVIDKVFADVADVAPNTFDPTLSNGMFGTMQAARALLGENGVSRVDEVKIWEVVNFDTVTAIHRAESAGGDPAVARQRGYDQSLMARFGEKVITQLGLQPAAPAQISGGDYEPLSGLAKTLPRPSSGGDSPFVFSLPSSGEPVTYQYGKDSQSRRRRNGEEYRKYRTENPAINDSTPAFMRFDVTIPVRPRP